MNYDEGRREGFEGSYGGRGRRGSGYSAGSGIPKPVKAGDEVEVKIEAIATKGDGIAKKDGFVIFIKGANQGDTVKVRISEVKERFAVGEVIA